MTNDTNQSTSSVKAQMSTKILWVLNRLPRFGVQRFKQLSKLVWPIEMLLDQEVARVVEDDPRWGGAFLSEFKAMYASGAFERELDECEAKGIQIIGLADSAYPKRLASIYDPPLILYVRGNLIQEDEAAIGVVGTRRPTFYGLRVANRFAMGLVQRGFTIVSGLARGIDGEAHRGAIKSKGRTIAVLGCGVDIIYPRDHADLYEQIALQGAVISEFPMGTTPVPFNFPKRNRIISGLSLGVLVVEANEKSGSLITATAALEEGRDVFAIPGSIDSITSIGTNLLIQKGAKLVHSTDDIVEDLSPQLHAAVSSWSRPVVVEPGTDFSPPQGGHQSVDGRTGFGDTQKRANDDPIAALLKQRPLCFDEILSVSKMEREKLHAYLMDLELRGVVKRGFGSLYSSG